MKIDDYRIKLRTMQEWDAFLLQESGLPGPRGNIELAQAVADEGDLNLFYRFTSYKADLAPVNSPYEFLAFCGVVGFGNSLLKATPVCFQSCAGMHLTRAGVFARLLPWRSNDMATSIWMD